MAFLQKTPPQTPDTTRAPRRLQSTLRHVRMDAGAPLPRFAALLPCSPAPELPYAASPRCSPARPPPSLPPASRSSPAPLPASQIFPLSSAKSFLLPPAASPACAQRRHVLLVAHDAGGGTGQAAVARAAPARPRVRVGVRAGHRLGRAPVCEGGGRGFHSPPRRPGHAPRVPAPRASRHLPPQKAKPHDAEPMRSCSIQASSSTARRRKEGGSLNLL
ncbi:hypothetical protein VPH35_078936 [Triticum aestivum]